MFSFKKKEEKIKVDQNALVSANKTAALFDVFSQGVTGNAGLDQILANVTTVVSKTTIAMAEHKQKEEIKKLSEQNPKVALSEELARSIRDYSDELRLKQAFKNFISKGGDVNTPCKSGPLLNFAISVSNTFAFDLLITYGADVHKSTSEIAAPIVAAAGLNNEEMVNKLLKKGAHPDEFSSANALGYCITSIHSYTLIEHAAWNQKSPLIHGNDDKLSKKLKSWFYQSDEYSTKNAAKPVRFFTSINQQPLQALYCGNINLVGFLLNAGTRTSTTNVHGVSPRMIVETPEDYLNHFTSSEKEQLKLVEAKSGLFSFSITIWNRSESDSIKVEFVYSLKNIQNLFLKFRQENPNTYYSDEELLRMQSTFERRNNDLVNDRLQYEFNQHNEKLKYVENRVTRVEQESKENTEHVTSLQSQLSFIVQDASAKLLWEKLKEKIKTIEDPTERTLKSEFSIALITRLRSSIGSYVDLFSNFQQRGSYTKVDKINNFAQGIAGLIPVFGQYAPALGALATKIIDITEEEHQKRIAYLFVSGNEQDTLALTLGIRFTNHAWAILIPELFKTSREAKNSAEIILNKVRSVFEKTAEGFGDRVAQATWLYMMGLEQKTITPKLHDLSDYLFNRVTETTIFSSYEKQIRSSITEKRTTAQIKPMIYSNVYKIDQDSNNQPSKPSSAKVVNGTKNGF